MRRQPISDIDHDSRPPTRTPPAATAPAAGTPAPYNASTAQAAATSLVRLLMEQMGFGPDDITPGHPDPADEPVHPPRPAESRATRCHRHGQAP
ncbi:hypothetical protein ACIQWZ_33345 [Streptomyces sp. NPDC098077]|uniref:hypothetical protein n=1 Tax=Streptomyces sp. NPDC098077 TaxID=3366093 RepID=UPI00382FA2FB